MTYPLVEDLAADGISVAVALRVFGCPSGVLPMRSR
jgi:hypothetical protein